MDRHLDKNVFVGSSESKFDHRIEEFKGYLYKRF